MKQTRWTQKGLMQSIAFTMTEKHLEALGKLAKEKKATKSAMVRKLIENATGMIDE